MAHFVGCVLFGGQAEFPFTNSAQPNPDYEVGHITSEPREPTQSCEHPMVQIAATWTFQLLSALKSRPAERREVLPRMRPPRGTGDIRSPHDVLTQRIPAHAGHGKYVYLLGAARVFLLPPSSIRFVSIGRP